MLDVDELRVNCEFTIMYESYENTYTVKLLEEHNNKCVADKSKTGELAFEKSK